MERLGVAHFVLKPYTFAEIIEAQRREKHMLRYALVLSSLIGAILLAVAPQAMSQGTLEGFRTCPGEFALCAASICTPTVKNIAVACEAGTAGCSLNGIASFPEAQCTCPIFPGPSIADVNGGNMGLRPGPGNCSAPTIVNGINVGNDGIWSLYSPQAQIPQEINNWVQGKNKSAAPPNFCPDSATATHPNTFANCFSFACVRAGKINGVEVATCFCPMGENLTGGGVPAGTSFGTQAGQGNVAICSEIPVGAPFPFSN